MLIFWAATRNCLLIYDSETVWGGVGDLFATEIHVPRILSVSVANQLKAAWRCAGNLIPPEIYVPRVLSVSVANQLKTAWRCAGNLVPAEI